MNRAKKAKPSTTISSPVRLSGRRDRAIRADSDERPADREIEHQRRGGQLRRHVVATPEERRGRGDAGRHAAGAPGSGRPVTRRAAPRRAPLRSGVAAQLGLRDEPAGDAVGDLAAVVRPGPAGDQHDRGRAGFGGQRLATLESVDVGQLDVEQHDVGVNCATRGERVRAVGGLPDDIEAAGHQQPCGRALGTKRGRRRSAPGRPSLDGPGPGALPTTGPTLPSASASRPLRAVLDLQSTGSRRPVRGGPLSTIGGSDGGRCGRAGP